MTESPVELIWQVSNGECVVTDDVMITTVESKDPLVSIDYSMREGCEGEEFKFMAVPENPGSTPTYSWFINTILQPEDGISITRNNITDGSRVTVVLNSSETCTSVPNSQATSNDNTILRVTEAPESMIVTGDVTICENEIDTLLSKTNNTEEIYTWVFNGTPFQTDNDTTSILINSLDQNGVWELIVDNGICEPATSAPVNVIVDELPVVSLDQIELNSNNIQLISDVSVGTVLWSPSENLSSATDDNPIFTSPNRKANVEFTLTATNGVCTNQQSINVMVIPPIVVPNVFTPNNDDQNDSWEIDGLELLSEVDVKVFNRWGQSVFESFGYEVPWDGTSPSSNELPEGAYYYIINWVDKQQNQKSVQGAVNILK